MINGENIQNFEEKRTTPRKIVDEYFSVEFVLEELAMAYQFKIWDISPGGMCLIIKKDSVLLKYIKVGDIVNMKYYPVKSKAAPKKHKTEIMHISEDTQGRFKGHKLVGLSIRDNQSGP